MPFPLIAILAAAAAGRASKKPPKNGGFRVHDQERKKGQGLCQRREVGYHCTYGERGWSARSGRGSWRLRRTGMASAPRSAAEPAANFARLERLRFG